MWLGKEQIFPFHKMCFSRFSWFVIKTETFKITYFFIILKLLIKYHPNPTREFAPTTRTFFSLEQCGTRRFPSCEGPIYGKVRYYMIKWYS